MSVSEDKLFLDQVLETIKNEPPKSKNASRICVFCLGSSNIAAEQVSSYAFSNSNIDVHTVCDAEIPPWVDKKTDTIIIAYENEAIVKGLELFEKLKGSPAAIHCITADKKLADLCKKSGGNIFILQDKLDELQVTSYEIGFLVNLFESLGVKGIRESTLDVMPKLYKYGDELRDSKTIANLIAKIGNKLPAFYSVSELNGQRERWKNQFIKGLGKIAFSGEFPEFDHNEIVGWTEDTNNKEFIAVYITIKSESSALLNKIQSLTPELLKESNVNVECVPIEGQQLEQNIRGILLADAFAQQYKEMR